MKTGPVIVSERSGMSFGVDVPETGQMHASGKISHKESRSSRMAGINQPQGMKSSNAVA